MPLMNWDDSLDVGVPQMNAEHQEILTAMNKIFDAHSNGESGPRMNSLIARLGEICVRHFKDEEAFMRACAFPDLALHARIHAKLLNDFGAHAVSIEAAGGRPTAEFFNFLKLWLSAHIRGIDKKYGEHAARARAR
jgi:hemerythrin-like metal-binding protein